MSRIEKFLSEEEEHEIVQAILKAERNTSGEIRVHIEAHTRMDHFDRAKEVFHMLKMDHTKDENGVLIYVAVTDKKFVIYGAKGIDKVTPDNFWETTRDTIQSQFKTGNYKKGIIDGVIVAGKELETYFPWNHDDTNEISNEVSKG